MMYKCKNGHNFLETKARGQIIKDEIHFLECPFCGDLVCSEKDKLRYLAIFPKEHINKLVKNEEKLEKITTQLESIIKSLEKRKKE